ncbi:4'-phosphopantetheinyl transferase [Mucilaginibacter calamicampi]|uniref:Enterobactin synthase component D n=1 Tax=Mucilaginibacter calamicampi TaxID=1302352 RepID=A0ABW2YSB6_9SPHI
MNTPGPLLVLDAQIAQYFTDVFIDDTLLTAAEKAIVAGAAKKRIRDFSTGRFCAKQALAQFGLKNIELLRVEDKQPLWPPGFTGSISHANDFCGAVAVNTNIFKSIGLDIEKIGSITEEMWRMLYTEQEYLLLENDFKNEQDIFAMLLFSVKESFYKLQYPLTGLFLDFTDVNLKWDGLSFIPESELLIGNNAIDLSQVRIQWLKHNDYIVSLCYILK